MTTRFLCASCHNLLVEPKFIACGHRYCSRCLTNLINLDSSTFCSVELCGKTIDKTKIYPDFAIENELREIKDLSCRNKVYGCSWKGSYLSYKEHVDQCEFERFQCKLCSLSLNSRLVYEEHLKICPKGKIVCPLKKLGCREEIERELLREHIVSSFVEHFQLISDAFSSSPVRIEKENSNGENETIEQIRNEQKTLRALLLKREQELTKSRVDLQLYKGEICQLKKELELTKSLMSDDGTFLWKIENVQQLIFNAKNSSQTTCLTSPVFYTSRYGYKLSMKIYLNGDKTCRNTHLSLYITVMRGQYDSLLQWPFSYPITFCLYDRSSHQDHVVHTLTPDLTSESFQQPTMDANKSGGIPQFCPLCKVFSKEFGYVNENTMFVKAFVDFRIYPTKIWPNWTKLQSSGLPNHVESMKLRNFIENPK